MNARRFLSLACLLTLLLVACGASTAARELAETGPTPAPQLSPDSCPVTQPPDPTFVPPEPYAPTAPYGQFWYGSDALWTALYPEGHWEGLPHSEVGFAQKVFLWREGYDMRTEPQPQITMIGRRLDSDVPAFEHTGGTNGYHDDLGEFMLTGVGIPTVGCWEITAQYRKTSLSFVVWVGP